jgi:hypothetical protein
MPHTAVEISWESGFFIFVFVLAALRLELRVSLAVPLEPLSFLF